MMLLLLLLLLFLVLNILISILIMRVFLLVGSPPRLRISHMRRILPR